MAPIPPWDHLPIELLCELFKPLDFCDLISVSEVCTSFGRAASLSSKLHKRAPWLIIAPKESTEDTQNITDNYYSLSERKVYKKIPSKIPLSSMNVIGSSEGWLCLADDKSDMYLFNPITGKQITLPPVKQMDGISPITDEEGKIIRYATCFGEVGVEDLCKQFTKVILSRDPGEGEYIMVVVHSRMDQSDFPTQARTYFLRAGDDRWTLVDPEDTTFYHDLHFHDKLLYGVTEIGGVDVINFSKNSSSMPSVRVLVPEPHYGPDDDSYDKLIEDTQKEKYVVSSPWGDILVVWKECVYKFEGNRIQEETGKIDIYKVDTSEGKLVELKNLGDYTLFLGQEGCFFSASSPNLRPNSIYFREYYCPDRTSHICLSDLKLNQVEFDPSGEWMSYIPNGWITPTL